MASYHASFNYLGKNSADEGYILVAFEPDEGFKDTFLDMDQISEDYYDGTKKFLYGTRYNSTASVNITIVKMDGTDWSIDDNRKALRWLTGARTASWLDLCPYKHETLGWISSYSFLGTVKSPQQYKLDGRVVGLSFEFASITPWAYSSEQVFDRSIEQALIVDGNGVLTAKEISVDENGVLCNSATPGVGACFCVDDKGVLYVENIIIALIDNQTDDLYSYIYLDIEFINDTCKYLEIRNETLGEITRVENLNLKEKVDITGRQFIIAYTKNQLTDEWENKQRIFGDDFNFVWPRLAPGLNNFVIEGNGNGNAKFKYRYPMKVGDCAMDISVYGGDSICGCVDNLQSNNTVRWEDIVGTPTSIAGYGITNAYTMSEVDNLINNIEVPGSGVVGSGDVLINITLLAANWAQVNNVYAQEVTIDGIIANSRIDLYPNVEQINQLQDEDIMLTAENNDGIVKVYAIGGKPSIDYTIQAAIVKVQQG